jgi:ribosomal protein S12 methylthiotransferase
MDINVITLGCAKNLVDSEKLMQQLQAAGHHLLHDDGETPADIVLINTCGFINDAKEESINTILTFIEEKKRGRLQRLYVFGCLVQRYRDELQQSLPEVDAFFGVNDWESLLTAVGGVVRPRLYAQRLLTTPPHYAYLKIAEGCNWQCAYCAIPLIRGPYVSTPLERLVVETKLLAAQGVKELLITAQDTTYYGLDLYRRRRLAELLTALAEVRGIEWIRLLYAYPVSFPDELVALLRDHPKICRYLDLPLQHIADKVLKNMRRGTTGAQIRDLVARLRATVPGIALRTTLIVGHPGEDDDAFAELLAFVRETRFERLGVFAYSEEEGTYAAAHLPDTVPEAEKRQRLETLMTLQAGISQEMNNEKIGRVFYTLIDRQEGDYYVGRTQYDAPEVDNEVLIPVAGGGACQTGRFYPVRISEADEFDLYGTVVNDELGMMN